MLEHQITWLMEGAKKYTASEIERLAYRLECDGYHQVDLAWVMYHNSRNQIIDYLNGMPISVLNDRWFL